MKKITPEDMFHGLILHQIELSNENEANVYCVAEIKQDGTRRKIYGRAL